MWNSVAKPRNVNVLLLYFMSVGVGFDDGRTTALLIASEV
jgi:hypothetical protein